MVVNFYLFFVMVIDLKNMPKELRVSKMELTLLLVERYFKVPLSDMLSGERGCRLVCQARSSACFFLCQVASDEEVGRLMGGRTAQSVRKSVNRVRDGWGKDEEYAAKLGSIERLLNITVKAEGGKCEFV